MSNSNLEPEAPKILKQIKWLKLYGYQHKKIVLLAAVFILLISLLKVKLPEMYKQYINNNSDGLKTSETQKNIQPSDLSKSKPQNGKLSTTKETKNEGVILPIRQKESNKEIVRDYDKQKSIPNHNNSIYSQKESSAKLIDYKSETTIINNLPINKRIAIIQEPKQRYKYSCPDFNPDAVAHFTWLSKCKVNKFESLGSIDDIPYYFGLYNFIDHQDGYLNQGIIIFEGNSTSNYIKPLIFKVHLDIYPKIRYLGYSEPRIFSTDVGTVLVLSCALGGGSAIAYDNDYFFWNGSNWIELDSKKWESELKRKLPKGLSTWNALIIDLNDLTVTSDLWAEKDAHCCPTGGKVRVYLSIKQNRFTIDKLNFF
jgi:hypothetical protein